MKLRCLIGHHGPYRRVGHCTFACVHCGKWPFYNAYATRRWNIRIRDGGDPAAYDTPGQAAD